jgi:cyanophycin synthetase
LNTVVQKVVEGIFSRVERGTWMGHVIEHIALEIQTGMDTGLGRTRETKTLGTYNVVFSYTEENVDSFAAESAVAIAESKAGTEYDLESDLQKMREIRERCLGLVQEVSWKKQFQEISLDPIRNQFISSIGAWDKSMRFQATITCKTSSIAVDMACNKELTKKCLIWLHSCSQRKYLCR